MSLKLARRHSSPNWYLRGTIRGVTVDESTGVVDRKAAEPSARSGNGKSSKPASMVERQQQAS